MTTKHRPHMPRVVIEAFKAGDDDTLRLLLDLKLEVSPLDVDGPCPYPPRSEGARSWPKAAALRSEMLNRFR
jgi:hypothetical protein